MRAIALLLLLAAGPALAEGGPRPAEISAFETAVKAHGCVLTPDNSDAVLKAARLSPEVAAGVIQRLEEDHKAVAQGDRIRLAEGGCK